MIDEFFAKEIRGFTLLTSLPQHTGTGSQHPILGLTTRTMLIGQKSQTTMFHPMKCFQLALQGQPSIQELKTKLMPVKSAVAAFFR